MFALFALAALIASSGNLQEGKCDEYETLLYFLSECPTRCRSCDLNFTLTAGLLDEKTLMYQSTRVINWICQPIGIHTVHYVRRESTNDSQHSK